MTLPKFLIFPYFVQNYQIPWLSIMGNIEIPRLPRNSMTSGNPDMSRCNRCPAHTSHIDNCNSIWHPRRWSIVSSSSKSPGSELCARVGKILICNKPIVHSPWRINKTCQSTFYWCPSQTISLDFCLPLYQEAKLINFLLLIDAIYIDQGSPN